MTRQAGLDTLTPDGFETPEPAFDPDEMELTCKERLAAIQRRICYTSPCGKHTDNEWDADGLAELVEEAHEAGCVTEPAARSLKLGLEEPPADLDAEWELLTFVKGKFGGLDDG